MASQAKSPNYPSMTEEIPDFEEKGCFKSRENHGMEGMLVHPLNCLGPVFIPVSVLYRSVE